MSLSVVVKPNADFSSGNITRALLNQAATPTVAVAGSIGTEEIEDLSITNGKISNGTLTGDKLTDTTVGVEKLSRLGRGYVIAGEAKSEDDNIDGGATVKLKLPENGFLVGDGNDVKAMVFDNSASGAINMSQYVDSSTGNTSFKYDLRSQGIKSSHIASRSINLDKFSPNSGTAIEESTHSGLITFDGGEKGDEYNYGKAILTQTGGVGTVLTSGGKGEPMTFGSVMRFSATSDSVLSTGQFASFTVAHNFTLADGTTKVVPSLVKVVIVCVANTANRTHDFAIGDELSMDSFCSDGDESERVLICADDTNITVKIASGNSLETVKKSDGSEIHLKISANDQDFKIKVYAAY